MYSILSDDGSWVVVFDGDEEEPMELTVQEFIDRFGEENLPANDLQPGEALCAEELMPEMARTLHYWAAFRRLIKACGAYAWAVKIDQAEASKDYDACEVAKNLFGDHVETKLAIEIEDRRIGQLACAKKLNEWSQKVGFKPMSKSDIDILTRHLFSHDFRKRMYYRIDKYAKRSELVSARDLVIDVMKSFRKQNRLP